MKPVTVKSYRLSFWLKNMYAKTRKEREEKLAELIKTMKAEIAAEKKKAKQA